MGKDAASEAARAQGGGMSGYRADTWLNIQLEPMTKLWQGIGGHSNFFVSEEDAREARGVFVGSTPYQFAETLWRLAQVKPSTDRDPVTGALKGFRDGIREYVVDIRTEAAIGICWANPHLGSGSVLQYYVPNWEKNLHPTSRVFKFGAKTFPSLR